MDKDPENNNTNGADSEQATVEVTLSLNPDLAYQVREESRDLMKKEIAQLPPLKKGHVDIQGSNIIPQGERVEIDFYIRNGLDHALRISSKPMVIVINSKENEILAKQAVDLSKLGELPAYSARPGKIYFDRKNIYVDEIPGDDWSISFGSKPGITRTVRLKSLVLPKKFTKNQVLAIKKFIQNLPPLNPGIVDLSPVQAKFKDDGKLVTTLVIRNGNRSPVKFNKLNLAVIDAKQQEIAAAPFYINNMSMEPLSARLVSFAFSPENVSSGDIDLSRWSVYIKTNEN